MRRARWVLLLAFAVLAPASAASDASEAPLILERVIPLANVSGRIDHLTVDLRRQRLFVAELGNGSVDVLDFNTGKLIHRISGLNEPQGVLYAPQADVLVVASAGDGTVKFFDGRDYGPRGALALGDDADNIHLDPMTGRVIVGYGSGGLAIIDSGKVAKVGDIALSEHPEGFAFSGSSPRAFANVPDAHQIDVIDSAAGKVVGRWNPPRLAENFPMALDDAHHLVAVVFRSPARLALLDAASGRLLSNAGTCGDADDVFFDLKRDRLYASCGTGVVAVFRVAGTRLLPIADIQTQSGARTSLFVPELDRLFVAVRAGLFGSNASVEVFRPAP